MNLNTAIKDAITKGAIRVTRKPLAAVRHDLAGLKRQVAELRRVMRDLQKSAKVQAKQVPAVAEPEKPLRIRPTGPMVRQLRKKLGLTQTEMGRLCGVSGLTIWKWEKAPGRIQMRGHALSGFAKIRGLGKREAKKVVADMGEVKAKATVKKAKKGGKG